MPELTPDIAEKVVAACQANLGEATEALSRAFDGDFTLEVGEAGVMDASSLGFSGPGLALVLNYEGVGAAALLPEASGLVPEWYAAPDPTGESKLATLAQELGMLLMPDDFMTDDFAAGRVENIEAALVSAALRDDAIVVPISITDGDNKGTLSFLWPLSNPAVMLPSPVEEDTASEETPNAPPTPAAADQTVQANPNDARFAKLPKYARSLLKINVPVVVELASKKQLVSKILELGPGSIIKFEKSCDETLDLCIGDRKIAEGDVVKVGEKFGLRITTIALPEERFGPARKSAG